MYINREIIEKSIDHYGKDIQATVCMEELAELIQAVSKEQRGISSKSHLAEELADVLICVEMIQSIYGISDGYVQGWIDAKQDRMIKRMEAKQ